MKASSPNPTEAAEEIRAFLKRARAEERRILFEPEALRVLALLGVQVPCFQWLKSPDDLATMDLSAFPGPRVVVKIVSSRIVHKARLGGVSIVARTPEAVAKAMERVSRATGNNPRDSFLVEEFVRYSPLLGNEILVGLQWTADFGPVLTVGPGGRNAESLNHLFRPDLASLVVSPRLSDRKTLEDALGDLTIFGETATEAYQSRRVPSLAVTCEKLLEFSAGTAPAFLRLLEINPLVLTPRGWVALDACCTFDTAPRVPAPPRPLENLRHLLRPESIAFAGVSTRMNPGRTMLRNTIRLGFPRQKIFVIRPDLPSVENCKTISGLGDLTEPIDLFVIALNARKATQLAVEAIETGMAGGVILIPGGLGEKAGTKRLSARILHALERARERPGRGPLINGPNCLGIRSLQGGFDTLFVPNHKLPVPAQRSDPLALITQSGAIAVTLLSRLHPVNPALVVSVGNQMDLTATDYLEYLKNQPEITVFALYVEGFPHGEGLRFLETARQVTDRGGTVILYKAGRTPAGGEATASHTGSIAGNYDVTRMLCRQAGVLIAHNLMELEGLTRLSVLLAKRAVDGRRLAGISNAGFECVAMADNLGAFRLAELASATRSHLDTIFAASGILDLIDLQNPLDVTPMADDVTFANAARALLADPAVDVALICCVPLSPSLQTLLPGERAGSSSPRSVIDELVRIHSETHKAWVCVVDAGPQYAPLVQQLEMAGIPVFPKADLAIRIFDAYCCHRLRTRPFD